MTEPLMVDGRRVRPISAAIEAFVRRHLPRMPGDCGVMWIAETCWLATYSHEDMQPQHFAGWECLNPRQETPDA